MTTLYGISNCDTVKRARAWLTEHGAAHEFHDFKKAGVPPDRLEAWLAVLGWEKLVNRKGSTWRQLPEATREAVVDTASARALMRDKPSVIKRPVVEWDGGVTTVGFDKDWAPKLASLATPQGGRPAVGPAEPDPGRVAG